jgi:CxxC-x17-CxxC domain-containing protein
MEFQDKEITCDDCNQSFTFTADEQAFYQEKGLTHEPKRCKPCRSARKSRTRASRQRPQNAPSYDGAPRRTRDGHRGPSRGAPQQNRQQGGAPLFKADFGPSPWENSSRGQQRSRYPQGRSGRSQRLHDAVCSSCSTPTEVPFRPNGVQPVYCRTCLPKNKNRKPNSRTVPGGGPGGDRG